MIYFIKQGYGADCEDYEEGCESCRAKKVIEFLKDHISLIQW